MGKKKICEYIYKNRSTARLEFNHLAVSIFIAISSTVFVDNRTPMLVSDPLLRSCTD